MSPDLRVPLLAAAAWVGALAVLVLHGVGVPRWAVLIVVLVGGGLVAGVTVSWRRQRQRRDGAAPRGGAGRRGEAGASGSQGQGLAMLAAVLAVTFLAAGLASVRVTAAATDPVAQWAQQRRLATLSGTVRSDPRVLTGGFSRSVVVSVLVQKAEVDGVRASVRTLVRVLAPPTWTSVRLGERIRFVGRLRPADDPTQSAEVRVGSGDRSAPERLAEPGVWWRAAGTVRAAIRASVEGRPAERAALVPALVDGDTSAITAGLSADFKVTGLTHLLAVSGTNLTLVVGALLWLARWCRVRGRWLIVVGAAGIVGFVLLARTEPSVVRAAAMGTVGLIAMSANGRHRGLRALGVAVLALILVDPAMAVSIGFALSVLATAGILLAAPAWRDALARWMPRWLAEAIAVPMAAQLACTPLIAAMSGQVSLVAVAANLLAEPAVGPATVLGLLGGIVGVVWPRGGQLCGWCASWCVAWIIAVAHRGAAMPGAEIGWAVGAGAIVMLTVLVLALLFWAPVVVGRRWIGVLVMTVMVVVIGVRLPGGAWPPPGWLLVMCDVGQGDGLVLSVAAGTAIVIDAGPDPAPMEQCLDRLGVRQVPVALFTHFDADHVGGAEAVFHGRRVGQVWTTVLPGPAYGRGLVLDAAHAAGIEPRPARQGETFSVGPVTAQVLWPPPTLPAATDSNAGSVVLLVRCRGVTLLLAGDVDPAASARIARSVPGLRVDVLKVPHHGSRFQDEPWLTSLHAQVALTSVGAKNTYGHPAASTLDPLGRAGAEVYRTDQDGGLAVVLGADGLEVRTGG
ncbi:ComEC/Rec2 family competence protein [Nocardioides sp.]|uniref:ComEC/Rec2 family competence protein n=1 Tax=Nocardioides sp. TaxID=35761 RepID=UPI00262D60F7|nr:ComEC/Rec2 family competence protein [Nocardioides sp.]